MSLPSPHARINSGPEQPFIVNVGFDILRLICTLLFTISRWILGDPMPTIPGPDDRKLIQVRWSLPRKPRTVMSEWATTYGELFKLRIGFYDYIVINSPEAFHEIFVKQYLATSSKVPAPIGRGFANRGLNFFSMEYGTEYRTGAHQRCLHSGLHVEVENMRSIKAAVSESKRIIRALAGLNPGDSYFDAVSRTAFSFLMTIAYGRRIRDYDHTELYDLFDDSIWCGKVPIPFIGDEIPPLATGAKSLLATLASWIGRFSRGPSATKIVSWTYRNKMNRWDRVRDEVEKNKIMWKRAAERRVNVIMDDGRPNFGYFLAETRTVPVIISEQVGAWLVGGILDCGGAITIEAIHCLIQTMVSHPGIQRKAQQEVDQVCNLRGDHYIPHFGDLPDMPFVKACVKELLRLIPIIPWEVKHITATEITYRNYRIPRGTVLLANTPFLNRDPKRYHDPHRYNPSRFPEHFIGSSEEYARLPAEYAGHRDHFSFGGGARRCPGIYMAETFLELTLAKLLRAFDLVENPCQEEPFYKGSHPFGTDEWLSHDPVRVHFRRRRHFRTGVEIGDFTADQDDDEIDLRGDEFPNYNAHFQNDYSHMQNGPAQHQNGNAHQNNNAQQQSDNAQHQHDNAQQQNDNAQHQNGPAQHQNDNAQHQNGNAQQINGVFQYQNGDVQHLEAVIQ